MTTSFYFSFQISVCYRAVSTILREDARAKREDGPPRPPARHTCGASVAMRGTGQPDLDDLDHVKSPMAFEFELLSVEQPGEYTMNIWDLSDEEILEEIPKRKTKADDCLRSANHGQAVEVYHEALGCLERMSMAALPRTERWFMVEEMKVPLLLSYSKCKFAKCEYKDAIIHTTSVLKFDPDNQEALFLRAKSYVSLLKLVQAKEDYERVVEISSTLAQAAETELIEMREAVEAYTQAQQRKPMEEKNK